MVDDAARHHEARVKGASGDSTERVPCAVVEPVPEVVETMGYEVLRRSEVEPGIDCRYCELTIRISSEDEATVARSRGGILTFVDDAFETWMHVC